MIEEDRYCDDVLIQISAIKNSLGSIASYVLKEHLTTCVADEVKKGNDDILLEVLDLIGRTK